MPQPNTTERILDTAEHLVQTRGFNGFSYADIANSLKLTKASLHYHFPAKAELGRSLIIRYEQNFAAALATVDRLGKDARDKLHRYAAIYAGVLREDRMCLCGMLAAEYATLPKAMQKELRHFFEENERWLESVLQAGRAAGELDFAGSADELAMLFVGSLEGAMMLARTGGGVRRFRVSAERLIEELCA